MLSDLELEITQLKRQAQEHAKLLVPDVQIRERSLFVVTPLRLNDKPIHVIGSPSDLLRQSVLLMAREMIQMHIHELCELSEFVIQLCLGVKGHRYRSALQRYKAARKPALSCELVREPYRFSAQTPAPEPKPQWPPERGHISAVE